MAQLLFETVPASGVSLGDNQTVVAVHGLIDQPVVTQSETSGSLTTSLEDSDMFQCGKCKKQFIAIEAFVNHKIECNGSNVTPITDISMTPNVCNIPQNTVVVRKIQIPTSLSNYTQNLILTEADLLQLSAAALDPNTSNVVTSNSSIHITPNHVLLPQTAFTSHGVPVQHVLQPVTTEESSQQPQTVELSIINDKFISRPIILTSQQHNNTISSVVLNISNAVETETVLCENTEVNKSNELVEPATNEVLNSNNNADEQNESEKNQSTVNIITEFHSSMVKTKKTGTENENEDNQNKKDTKLNCAYCWKSFTKNFDLQQHIRCHTGEKPFQCIVCGRAFAQKSNVKKHMQTHKVWPDGLSRTLPHLLSKHNSSSNDDGDGIGDNPCPDEPDEQSEQEKTANDKIDKNSYACPYCTYIGKSYYKLKSHMKQHDAEKVYKCILSTCGQMFNELEPFLDHTKSHENEMTYRCHECNKNFLSLYELGSHQFTHSLYPNSRARTSRRFFQCHLCLNKYATPAALDHHLATSSHTYSCSWCDKVFPCERYLRRHLQIHSESESFTCNVCGKGFKTESYLKVHKLVHSEEKPYECSVCKAAFNRKDKLKRHSLIHEPVKRYKCPFRTHCGCQKEFNRADKLKSHILTHSCAKPYTCTLCDKHFTRKAHLSVHMRQYHEEQAQESSSSCLSMEDSVDSKINKSVNKKLTSNKRPYYRSRRQKKKMMLSSSRNSYGHRKKMRTERPLTLNDAGETDKDGDIDSSSEIVDDIPTAHIEIISAHGTLVGASELTQISLPDMNYNDLQFDSAEDETGIPSAPPIAVDALHPSNASNLLPGDLQSNDDITDYS